MKGSDIMKHKYSFFCDAANVDCSGKVSALGIFTNIRALQFPAVHPVMTFVACIEGRSTESGRHPFRINFINDDGKDIMPAMQGEIDITQSSLTANIMLNLSTITFPKPGTYTIDLVVDNQVLVSESLNVILLNQK
jgi:hypothetical protein